MRAAVFFGFAFAFAFEEGFGFSEVGGLRDFLVVGFGVGVSGEGVFVVGAVGGYCGEADYRSAAEAVFVVGFFGGVTSVEGVGSGVSLTGGVDGLSVFGFDFFCVGLFACVLDGAGIGGVDDFLGDVRCEFVLGGVIFGDLDGGEREVAFDWVWEVRREVGDAFEFGFGLAFEPGLDGVVVGVADCGAVGGVTVDLRADGVLPPDDGFFGFVFLIGVGFGRGAVDVYAGGVGVV